MAGRVIGEADVDVNANTSGLGQQAERDVKRELGGALKGAGLAVGAILGGAILGAMSQAITAASDLNETASAVRVIFGSGADAIVAFSKTAAKALGQSEQAALSGAKTFATYGKMANLSGQELVDFTTKTLKLASDLASFNNTTPEEAIESIGAAFRGESDPIEKYGVLINEASIQTEAFRIGLIKTEKEALAPNQRVMAVLSLIYKQTADAQDDFARTSTGLANTLRIQKAEYENQKALLGQQLLPIFMKVVAWLAKIVPPIIAWVKANKVLVSVLAGLVVVLWAVNIALAANPVVLVGLAIVALVGAVIYAYNHFEWFKQAVDGQWRLLQQVAAWFTGPFVQYIRTAVDFVVLNWQRMIAFFQALPGTVMAFLQALPARLRALFVQAFDAVTYAVGFGIGTVLRFFITLPGRVINAILALPDLVVGVFNWIWRRAADAVRTGTDLVLRFFLQIVPRVMAAVAELPPRFFSFWMGLTDRMYNIGQDIVKGLIRGITSYVGQAVEATKRAVGNIIDGAKDALGIRSPSKVFADMGRQSVAGYVKGVQDMASQVRSTVAGVIGGPAGAGGTTTTTTSTDNSRSINVNVYGAAGQSADEISARVMRDLAWNEGI